MMIYSVTEPKSLQALLDLRDQLRRVKDGKDVLFLFFFFFSLSFPAFISKETKTHKKKKQAHQ